MKTVTRVTKTINLTLLSIPVTVLQLQCDSKYTYSVRRLK